MAVVNRFIKFVDNTQLYEQPIIGLYFKYSYVNYSKYIRILEVLQEPQVEYTFRTGLPSLKQLFYNELNQ